MCIGVPMVVTDLDGDFAWCEADGARERIDMRLVGPQPPGTWVLAFHGAARQVMDETEARQARAGRAALAAAMRGDAASIDELFADLVSRTPELPAHLRPGAATEETP